MATKRVTVAQETSSGLNTRFNVAGQGVVPRGKLADQVEQGQHPGYHVRRLDGQRIIASNPDGKKDNNLG